MSYKKNKYKIVKNAIPLDVALFLFDYFQMKRNVYHTFKNTTYISKHDDYMTLDIVHHLAYPNHHLI